MSDTSTNILSYIWVYIVRITLSLLELAFIGRSDSNHSAFYLYREASGGTKQQPFIMCMYKRTCRRGVACVRHCPHRAILSSLTFNLEQQSTSNTDVFWVSQDCHLIYFIKAIDTSSYCNYWYSHRVAATW